jgi:hypothetical protein
VTTAFEYVYVCIYKYHITNRRLTFIQAVTEGAKYWVCYGHRVFRTSTNFGCRITTKPFFGSVQCGYIKSSKVLSAVSGYSEARLNQNANEKLI